MTKATGSTSQATEQSTQELNTETIADPNVKTAILENPIKHGDIQITEIKIRKPNVGTLRNLSLQDVLKWEINAVNTVLTRVTQPTLNVTELNAMDVSDYTTLTVELTSFLVSAKAKSQVTLMTS